MKTSTVFQVNIQKKIRVADADPVGSASFRRIRIWMRIPIRIFTICSKIQENFKVYHRKEIQTNFYLANFDNQNLKLIRKTCFVFLLKLILHFLWSLISSKYPDPDRLPNGKSDPDMGPDRHQNNPNPEHWKN